MVRSTLIVVQEAHYRLQQSWPIQLQRHTHTVSIISMALHVPAPGSESSELSEGSGRGPVQLPHQNTVSWQSQEDGRTATGTDG